MSCWSSLNGREPIMSRRWPWPRRRRRPFLEWQGLSDLGFLWASRDYSQAGQWFHRALDLAQALADPRLQANSLNRLGNWLVNTGHVAEGIQAHQQALQLFETQQDTRGMAETYDLLGMANSLSGDLVTAVKLSGQAIELFRAAGDISSLASSLSLRAGYSLSETTFSPLRTRDECVQEAAEALRLSRQVASPGAEAFAELILGHVLAPFGEFGSALAHAQEACRIATEIGHRQWAAGAYCVLGGTYLLQLEPTFARDMLETGLALARELGSTWWIIQTTIPLARVYLLKNELEQAEAALAAVLPREQRPRDQGERSARLVWGELALAQGQASYGPTDRARTVANRSRSGQSPRRSTDPPALEAARGGPHRAGTRRGGDPGLGGS